MSAISGTSPTYRNLARRLRAIESEQKLLGHSTPALTAKVYRRGKERVMPLALRP